MADSTVSQGANVDAETKLKSLSRKDAFTKIIGVPRCRIAPAISAPAVFLTAAASPQWTDTWSGESSPTMRSRTQNGAEPKFWW